jgi:hypothetical protein
VAIGAPTVATPANGTASPATVNAPAGRAVNDVLIVSYSQDSASRTLTTPSGWTLVDGPTTSSTQAGRTFVRYADGTSADNFSATISGATQWLCNMVAYPGVDVSGAILTTAIVAHGANFDASAVTAMITPSQSTPAKAGCVLVGMFTADAASTLHTYSPTSTSPSVGTPVERYDNNEGTGFLCSAGYDTVGLTLAQSTAYTMTATCNGAEIGTHYAFILAPAVGGTNYTGSPADAEGITDSATQTVDSVRTSSDPVGVTDSASPAIDAIRTLPDPVGVTDSATVVMNYVVTLTDSVGLTDSATGTIGATDYTASPADPEGITDTATAVQGLARTQADAAGITDSVTAARDMVTTATDPVGLSDSVIANLARVTTVADLLGLVDAPSFTAAVSRPTADPTGITDSAVGVLDRVMVTADMVGLTDVVAAELNAVVATPSPERILTVPAEARIRRVPGGPGIRAVSSAPRILTVPADPRTKGA